MKKNILFVADNPNLRDRLAVALREAGYGLIHAADETEPDELTGSTVPDLLLIDLDLESASAWDIYAEWKARHPGLRTVAMTGVPNRFGVTCAVGMDALMEKPVHPSLLLRVIASVIEDPARAASHADPGDRANFPHLTTADTRYWRSLRGRRPGGPECRAA